MRKRVEIDLAGGVETQTGVMALVVRLLDETLIRVGNREYARDNETFGLTTLRPDHVDRDGGDLVFDFRGKGGSEVRVSVPDPDLVAAVLACQELGGQQLFSYLGGDDLPVSVDSDQVNRYLGELTGSDVTAKDFRTWGATAVVAGALAGSHRTKATPTRRFSPPSTSRPTGSGTPVRCVGPPMSIRRFPRHTAPDSWPWRGEGCAARAGWTGPSG